MLNLSEAEVKKGVEDYLQVYMNQGKLWYARLNAGDIPIQNKDGSHRMFKGVKAGTADYIVVQGGEVQMFHTVQKKIHRTHPVSFVTFIECKSTKGKQEPDQVEFEEQVKKLNCRYHIVRDVDELPAILERV